MALISRKNVSQSLKTAVRFARTTVKPGRKQSHSVGKQSMGATSSPTPTPTPIVKRGITEDVSPLEHQPLHSAQ